MIGAACQLPGETLGKGEAMHREFVVNVFIDYFIESHDTYLLSGDLIFSN
jgi:hypothetical protein